MRPGPSIGWAIVWLINRESGKAIQGGCLEKKKDGHWLALTTFQPDLGNVVVRASQLPSTATITIYPCDYITRGIVLCVRLQLCRQNTSFISYIPYKSTGSAILCSAAELTGKPAQHVLLLARHPVKYVEYVLV